MVLPLAAKVLIPVGIGLAGLLGFVATAKAGPAEGEISEAIRNKIQAAIATGDPTTIRRVADEIERAGLTAQAKSMRDAADAIERAIDDVRPTPVSPGGGVIGPSTPPTPSEARIVVVKAGEGPFQVTQRAGINTKLFKQLRDRNVPFDADGVRRKGDGKSGFLPPLDAGDRLFVPETWPDSPAFQIAAVTPPASLAGDGDDDDDDPRERVQRLAGRVALDVQASKKGREDRNLIHALQVIAKRKGQRSERPNGLYDAETICQLARQHGIVPPARFGDDKGPYWPTNAAPAQRVVRECLIEMADRDPVRAEEWKQAAACFA